MQDRPRSTPRHTHNMRIATRHSLCVRVLSARSTRILASGQTIPICAMPEIRCVCVKQTGQANKHHHRHALTMCVRRRTGRQPAHRAATDRTQEFPTIIMRWGHAICRGFRPCRASAISTSILSRQPKVLCLCHIISQPVPPWV